MTINLSHKELYLGTIRDLEAKVATGDFYSLVKASGLLRGLLIDGTSLLDAANRDIKLKLRFEILDNYIPAMFTDLAWYNIDPSEGAWHRIKTVDRKQLLGTQCLTYCGVGYSVRDVIAACANAKGGVHIGNPRAEVKGIVDMDAVAREGGLEVSVRMIRGIAKVVIAGLKPLTEAVEQQLRT